MKSKLSTMGAFLVLMIGVIVASVPAFTAQDTPPIYLSLSNDYISFDWGVGNTVNFTIGTTAYAWDVAGRYSIRSVEGDPESSADDGFDLIPRGHDIAIDSTGKVTYDNGFAPCNKFAYIKVKVGDNVPSIIGVSGGSWTKRPAVFTPPDGLGFGKNGSFLEGEWTTTENVAVQMDVHLVRDQVRFEFAIKNKAAVSQSVGLQLQGAAFNPLQNSGFQIGPVFIPGFGLPDYGKAFTSTTVPDTLEKMNSIPAPTIVARNLLAGQDAVKPNRIAVGNQNAIVGAMGLGITTSDFSASEQEMWLEPHTGFPAGSFVPDVRVRENNMGWAACWDRKTLAPNASRKIVTYYGIGVADSTWTVRTGNVYNFDSATLAVQSIRSLKYNTTNRTRTSDFSPSAFTVKAYVDNLSTDTGVYDLQDVNVSLLLPEGLQLVSGKAVQSLGYIGSTVESGPATWTVRADGTVSGSLEYFVKAQDSVTGWNQIVSRKILVPAAGSSTLKAGWQLMGVPFIFTNRSPNSVFNKLPGQLSPKFWGYSTSTSGSYGSLLAVTPGQGFWNYVSNSAAGPFTVAADRKIYGELNGTQGASLSIDLKPGFNLVSSPYVFPVFWGQTQFYNKSLNLALPLDKAVLNGWVDSSLFTWNSSKGQYDLLTDPQRLLEPWKGYWIRAKRAITMVLSPLQWPASSVTVPSGG